MSDHAGENVWLGGKRLGAVERGNVFKPCRPLTDDEWDHVNGLLGVTYERPEPTGVNDETDETDDDTIPV